MPRARIRKARLASALRPPTNRMTPPAPPAPRASATSRVHDPHPGTEVRAPEASGSLRSPVPKPANVNLRGSQRMQDVTNAAKRPRGYKTS